MITGCADKSELDIIDLMLNNIKYNVLFCIIINDSFNKYNG